MVWEQVDPPCRTYNRQIANKRKVSETGAGSKSYKEHKNIRKTSETDRNDDEKLSSSNDDTGRRNCEFRN